MTRLISLLLLLALALPVSGQSVFTSDIDHFWEAYDSVRTTKDSALQRHFIQTLYVDKGTEGLKAFMEARKYTVDGWQELIRKYPAFWESIRPNTLVVKDKSKEIEASIRQFKQLYPELKEARMYFTIGGLRSGGTVKGNMVLIGTEIATGDAYTNVSEFKNKWLADVFKAQSLNNIIPLNIHEYVHTQQTGNPLNLLGQAIGEGSCDFIAELVMGKPMQTNYIAYGRKHEAVLKEQFKEEMFAATYDNWLYNGADAKTVADLGYFMGYAICRSYYEQAANKKEAIKQIITLNYADSTAVEQFLKDSKYFKGPIDKAALVRAYNSKCPYVTGTFPFTNGDTLVDAGITELKINFSEPMSNNGYSFSYGPGGKKMDPIAKAIGYSADMRSFTVQLKLQPGQAYEFVITGNSFRSPQNYPLQEYYFRFSTK